LIGGKGFGNFDRHGKEYYVKSAEKGKIPEEGRRGEGPFFLILCRIFAETVLLT
jgi:hypothetical protein